MLRNSAMAVSSLRNFWLIALTLLYLTTTQASVLPTVLPDGSTTTNIQGPGTQTKIMGPDGSVIVAENPGGQIVHQETPGVFEPAGRILDEFFLGPAVPMFVPGEEARNAVAGSAAGTLATGNYVAQSGQDGAQSIAGGMVGLQG
ncbi:unnamed protein product [Ceutorhynchus assimilis]|uniref:Secreted protein n=1 Tax=Ceutorhynchus assimilis TaxID=467358 RepID=A0A9N9MJS7_9CUCU|nr:unnamed protein product [Ceutorhynchus assimilis]